MCADFSSRSDARLAGISIERLLAAQAQAAWICDAETCEVLACNPAAAAHLGCRAALPAGHRLAAAGSVARPVRAVVAWPEDDAPQTALWALQRPAGGTMVTPVSVVWLDETAPGRILVTAQPPPAPPPPPVARRTEDELLRAAKRESLELLAGGVAHDFNNLLTALMGNLAMARMDTGLNAEVQEWLAEAEKAAGRARDLTRQLLAFANGGEPVRRLAELGPGLREAAQFARQGSRVRCELSVADDLWPAEVDMGQIGQVVHNLVLNAVQAMPGGGVVTVTACNLGGEAARALGLGAHPFVAIEVRDTGPGIKPEDMVRLFQPHFTTKRHGSGLGLVTSQAIARRHCGALRVESPPGAGAVFRLYLPAQPGAVVAGPDGEPTLPQLRGRVLFMDDEASIRQMVPTLLGRLGLTSEVVADGGAAIEAYNRAVAEGRRPDVVILDLTVPAGLGALETLHRLRAQHPGVRALVSSGYAADPVLLNHQSHGFCGAVIKPYRLGELAEVLGRTLRPACPEAEAQAETRG
ncbi:MAG TPA: ATP-binding protein [Opitutaceae bacterium]|nr:ATP-binding protein [Opitutaceae bacterium]